MPTYPQTNEDTVIYGERNLFLDGDTFVKMLDSSRLDINGTVLVNNRSVSNGEINVSGYGAVGDGVHDDTNAIQVAFDIAGGNVGTGVTANKFEVHLNSGSIYRITATLTLPENVSLIGHGAKIITTVDIGTILLVAGSFVSVSDIQFQGSAAYFTKGIRVDAGRCKIDHCTFDQMGGQAILVYGGACWVQNCFAQNCLKLADSLISPAGVLHLESTANDCWILNCEFTASRTTMSAPGYAYGVAVFSANNTLNGVIAEISDHGFYFSSASYHRVSNCRADLNRGHGFVLAAGSGGTLSACIALSNGRETANTYDGYNFVNTSRWVIDGCMAMIATGNSHRYGFNDATNSGSVFNTFSSSNHSQGHGTAPINIVAFAGGRVAALDGPHLDMTAAVTTHDVQLRSWPHSNWSLKSTGPVSFTNFTNGVTGMRLSIRGDGNTTFVHNTSFIRMKAGANLLAASNVIYNFVNVGGIWFEV
jgi:parallel beta-helix repeat protein